MPDLDVTDLRNKSVTRDESAVLSAHYMFWPVQGMTPRLALNPEPPAWWSQQRDYVLRQTLHAEGMWASALAVAVTKVQSAGFEVDSEVGLRAKMAHELLTRVDFCRGYKRFMAKLALDFLTTDNGAFVEIIRASDAPGAKIVGLAQLDSLRCVRTGDDEAPVVYTDNIGHMHELRDYQVFDLVDMPNSSESWNGVGLCAASRAYGTIYKLSAAETYVSEAVSGRTPTKLVFIGGIPMMAIENAMKDAAAQADQRGLTTYMGAAVQAALSDKPLSTVEVRLKEIPEGFDVEKERNDGYLKYANALGLDPQELQPLTGRPLGTATQSQVLDDKQGGKGLVAFFGTFSEMMNLKVLPDATTHHFTEKDYRDQQAAAQVKLTRAQTRAAMIADGEIKPAQALQMAVDEGDAPREFLPTDQTPDDKLSDDEKPSEEQPAAAQVPQPDEAQPAPEQQPEAETVARTETKECKAFKEHDGAMLAFFLPAETAMALNELTAHAVTGPGVEITPVDEMHLTLTYLGKASELGDRRGEFEAIMRPFAAGNAPVAGEINGILRFERATPEGLTALCATFDSPALPHFRELLAIRLLALGVDADSIHGFIPHITLAYLPADMPTPDLRLPRLALTFDRVILAWAGEHSEFPLGDVPATAKETTLKASRVELVTVRPQFTRPKFPGEGEVSRLQQVTQYLDDYMQVLRDAAREECPVSEKAGGGATRDSIGYLLRNRNTRSVEGMLYAGNKERPEIVVRSVLFGRRGFGPKKPGGHLVFEGKGGELVYATRVGPAAANDWFKRAWARTARERTLMAQRIGALETEPIRVSDATRENAPHIDGYSPRKANEAPARIVKGDS